MKKYLILSVLLFASLPLQARDICFVARDELNSTVELFARFKAPSVQRLGAAQIDGIVVLKNESGVWLGFLEGSVIALDNGEISWRVYSSGLVWGEERFGESPVIGQFGFTVEGADAFSYRNKKDPEPIIRYIPCSEMPDY